MVRQALQQFYELLNADADEASQRFWHYFPALYHLEEGDPEVLEDFVSHDRVRNQALLLAIHIGRQVQLARRPVIIDGRFSANLGRFAQQEIGHLKHEQLNLALVNAQLEVISWSTVFVGGLTQITVSPREIFQKALRTNAYGMMIVHNHPSGQLQPSKADINFAKRLYRLGQSMDLPLLDAFVVTNSAYYSFSEQHDLN